MQKESQYMCVCTNHAYPDKYPWPEQDHQDDIQTSLVGKPEQEKMTWRFLTCMYTRQKNKGQELQNKHIGKLKYFSNW